MIYFTCLLFYLKCPRKQWAAEDKSVFNFPKPQGLGMEYYQIIGPTLRIPDPVKSTF